MYPETTMTFGIHVLHKQVLATHVNGVNQAKVQPRCSPVPAPCAPLPSTPNKNQNCVPLIFAAGDPPPLRVFHQYRREESYDTAVLPQYLGKHVMISRYSLSTVGKHVMIPRYPLSTEGKHGIIPHATRLSHLILRLEDRTNYFVCFGLSVPHYCWRSIYPRSSQSSQMFILPL